MGAESLPQVKLSEPQHWAQTLLLVLVHDWNWKSKHGQEYVLLTKGLP